MMLRLVIPATDENLLQATLVNFNVNGLTDLAAWYSVCEGPVQQALWLTVAAIQAFTPAGREITADDFAADVRNGSFQGDVLRQDLRDFVCGMLECGEVPGSLNSAVVPAVAMFLEEAYHSP